MSLLSNIQANTNAVASGKGRIKLAIEDKGGIVDQSGTYPTFSELVNGINTISGGGGGGGGEDITEIGELPYSVTHIDSYRDNQGDLHLTWVNPPKAFGNSVVLVRKLNGIPTLPIGGQDYNIIENGATGIHFDKTTIPADTKYGFLILPFGEDGRLQTMINNGNTIIDKTKNIQGEYVEVELPDDLKNGGSAIKTFITSDGDIFLSTTSSSYPGIWRLDKEQNAIIKIYDYGYNWTTWFESKNGNVYCSSTVSGYTGVTQYNKTLDTFEKVFTDTYQCARFFEDHRGNIYGSPNSLSRFIMYNVNTGEWSLKYNYTGSSNYQVGLYNWYEDSRGLVWFWDGNTSQLRTRLGYYDPENDTIKWYFNSSGGGSYYESVHFFAEDGNGNIFVTITLDGYTRVYRIDNNLTWSATNLNKSGSSSYFVDSHGNFFAVTTNPSLTTTEDPKIYRFDNVTNTFVPASNIPEITAYNNSSPNARFFESSNGELFLAFNGTADCRGFYKYNYNINEFELINHSASLGTFLDISYFKWFEDSIGNIFSACKNNMRVFWYDRANNEFVSIFNMTGNYNFSFADAGNGEVYWSMTGSSGLYKVNFANRTLDKVFTSGSTYKVVSSNASRTLLCTDSFSDTQNVVYDKIAGTFTGNTDDRRGINFTDKLLVNSNKKIYHIDTDILEDIQGSYSGMVNIDEKACFNCAISTSTTKKYLIYNK